MVENVLLLQMIGIGDIDGGHMVRGCNDPISVIAGAVISVIIASRGIRELLRLMRMRGVILMMVVTGTGGQLTVSALFRFRFAALLDRPDVANCGDKKEGRKKRRDEMRANDDGQRDRR